MGSQLRCTVSFCIFSATVLLWRSAARVLPREHPARPFAEGCAELTNEARTASKFTPHLSPVARGAVIAWTVACAAWLAALACELSDTTEMLWAGYLPGF